MLCSFLCCFGGNNNTLQTRGHATYQLKVTERFLYKRLNTCIEIDVTKLSEYNKQSFNGIKQVAIKTKEIKQGSIQTNGIKQTAITTNGKKKQP